MKNSKDELRENIKQVRSNNKSLNSQLQPEAIDQVLALFNTELDKIVAEIEAVKPDTYLLGCAKHWSDDSSATCTCDENERTAKSFHDKAITKVKHIIDKYRG